MKTIIAYLLAYIIFKIAQTIGSKYVKATHRRRVTLILQKQYRQIIAKPIYEIGRWADFIAGALTGLVFIVLLGNRVYIHTTILLGLYLLTFTIFIIAMLRATVVTDFTYEKEVRPILQLSLQLIWPYTLGFLLMILLGIII